MLHQDAVRICDRCSSKTKLDDNACDTLPLGWQQLELFNPKNSSLNPFDLCPSCVKGLYEWATGLKERTAEIRYWKGN